MASAGAFLLLVLNAVTADAAPLRAVHLGCEYEREPLGVGVARPRLSWKLEGDGRGRLQTAFQIRAATTEARVESEEPDLLDTGKLVSSAQTGIRYSGRARDSNQEVFWRVRVWDEGDEAGPWSGTAQWRTGLLRPEDWRARWIGTGNDTPLPLPLFRRAFTTSQPVRRAIVHVSGLGHYDLFLDGHRVGDRFLDPAWSVYEKTIYYASYDITDLLTPGPHVIGVMLGKGFYHTAGDRRVHGVNSRRPLLTILQAHLTLVDGSTEVLVTDGSWHWRAGPITHSAILGGEDYDARRVPPGWNRPGFDDSAWATAVEMSGPGGTLVASLAPPMKRLSVLPAVRIDQPAAGVFVYDFGQNAASIPQLRIRGQAGQTVKLTPAEQRHGMSPRRNDGRGRVNPAGVGTPNYFRYTLRGDGPETWSPQFTYSGYQYLEVEGAVPAGESNPESLPEVEELVSVVVRNDSLTVGEFECSEPLFNRIDRLVDQAVRANLAHVLTDCPHREKLGWLEVPYLMGPAMAGRYDLARFFAKIARDCGDSQGADGEVPTVAPAYPKFDGGFAYTPEWGAAAVVIPWLGYEWYGDLGVLEDSLPDMRRFVEFMRGTAQGLVPRAGLGDWYDYGHGKAVGASQFTPPELTAMATFHRCAGLVAEASRVLGDETGYARYHDLARAIELEFNRLWFDGIAAYRNHGSPQTANSMALVLGLAPKDRAAQVLERVVADIRARGNQQTAGDIGHWYLLEALAEGGRSELVFDLTIRTNLGSYGFIANSGWTSMPEAWDADTGASMNHCMLGHIQEWFLGRVAGIRPDPAVPGFAGFRLEPEPVGNLIWARGRLDSIRGRIRSEWRRDGNRFWLEAAIPPNTRARLRLPAIGIEGLREGNRPIREVAGVRVVAWVAGRVELELGSGVYQFASEIETSPVTPAR